MHPTTGRSWFSPLARIGTIWRERNLTLRSKPIFSKAITPKLPSLPSRVFAWQEKHLTGWRMGVASSAIAAGAVLLANAGFAIWASTKDGITGLESGMKENGNIKTLHQGSCDYAEKMSTWLHLLINILGSTVLSASNYTMQCLSAPTREEVDKAHSKGMWVDIGVPSVRNLRAISWKRGMLWWCIALSSMPLHFIYNSVVYSTIYTNAFRVTVITANLLDSEAYFIEKIGHPIEYFEKLDRKTCITEYHNEFLTKRKDLLIITTHTNTADDILTTHSQFGLEPRRFWWMCYEDEFMRVGTDGQYCDLKNALKRADNWETFSYSVDYCLSEPMEEFCRLEFSMTIMIVIVVCNLIKTICMVLTVWKQKTPPLATIGDAIASFVEVPDRTTKGMCTVSKKDICTGAWKNQKGQPAPNREELEGKRWVAQRHFWFQAASLKRWLACYMLGVVSLSLVGYLASLGYRKLETGGAPTDIATLWDLGFGAVNSNTLIQELRGPLLQCIFIANLPQAILSFFYFTFNGLYTCMLAADEWSRFFLEGKYLRVTSPKGNQKSTYFLQLPYQYALPLVAVSSILHWLVSQSIFLASIVILINGATDIDSPVLTTCGFSMMGIIFFMATTGILLLLGLAIGFLRRYRPGMPLVSSCSAAISAACHVPSEELLDDVVLQPLQWGVVSVGHRGVGHCSFSAEVVRGPVPGQFYAGMEDAKTVRCLKPVEYLELC